jgi:hypothetical protein
MELLALENNTLPIGLLENLQDVGIARLENFNIDLY